MQDDHQTQAQLITRLAELRQPIAGPFAPHRSTGLTKRLTLACLLLIAVVGRAMPAATVVQGQTTVAQTARILYLNSYHRGYVWSDEVERGLRERLTASGWMIELSVEYLDSRRFPDQTNLELLARLLAAKYAAYPFDLVIVSDNAAFDFAIKHRAQLSPGKPIVFCGFNSFRPAVLNGITTVTGVNEELDMTATVDLALKVQPATRTLVFITSTGDASSKSNAAVAESTVFPKYRDRYHLVEIKDASMAEIQHRLAELPRESVVFLIGQTSDQGEGRALTPEENGQLISAASPFPVYTFWDFHLNTGVLGGHILTGTDQGHAAADLAVRILNGTRADDIPVVMTSPASDVFDYVVMQRLGIADSALPANSVVINRPSSVWDLYHDQIIIIAASLVILILLVAFLIVVTQRLNTARLALSRLNANLETQVQERTAALSQTNHNLELEITERKRAEAQLRESNAELQTRNEELDAFAHMVAHDLINPLGVMLGYAELLLDNFGDLPDEDVRQALETVSRNGQKADSIIESLLLLASVRKQDVQVAPLDMAHIVDEVVLRLADSIQDSGADIRVPDRASWPVALGHPLWVEEVWVNYLSNAIKYGGEPPRIDLGTARQPDGFIRFSVRDYGAGLTPEQRQNLFAPFERLGQARVTGHGLGLSVVRRIVEKLGGQVGVDSQPDMLRGSTFYFTLPAAPDF